MSTSDTAPNPCDVLESSCGNGFAPAFEVTETDWILTEENPSYHGWPTLVNVGNDKLALVCSGGRESHIDPYGKVLLYESCDGGKSWTAPRIIANGPLDDRDAGLTVTAKGTWLVNYFTSLAYARQTKENTPPRWKKIEDHITISMLKEEHGFFMLRSEDEGKSWSPKYRIPVNNVHGAILLDDGSLFYCGREDSGNVIQAATFSDYIVCYRSTDDGKSWELISRFATGDLGSHSLRGWHELHSVQCSDTSILTQIRYTNSTWQMRSRDGGRTFDAPHQVCGGFPSHLLKLADGRLLMSYGYRASNYGIRCRISSDNGESWSEPMIISGNAPSPDLGYPSTVQLADGTFVTVWYQLRPEEKIASLRCARWKLM